MGLALTALPPVLTHCPWNTGTSGTHIGQGTALPLPLLPICGETREDVAAQLGMGLEILSAVSGVPVEELAKQMDALLTDSTEHCKGVNVILMEMFELDKPAGQLFCGSHTVLGFSSAMNAVVLRLELSMGLDKLLSTFMCSMELDSKNGSLAGQSLDMMLRLVCPEFKHKSWNYYGLFTQYLKEGSGSCLVRLQRSPLWLLEQGCCSAALQL